MHRFIAASLLSILAACATARADQRADATAIVDAAIKAAGGDKVANLKDYHFIAKDTSTQNGTTQIIYTDAWYEEHRERTITFDQDHIPTQIEVVNGDGGWTRDNGETHPMDEKSLAATREVIFDGWVTNVGPLKSKDYKLSVLDEIDVNGRKAVGLLVEHEKFQPVKLYFDKQTSLLAKLVNKYTDVEADKTTVYNQECIYSDYRDAGGVKTAFRLDVTWDGKKVSTFEIQKQTFFVKPQNDELFEKP